MDKGSVEPISKSDRIELRRIVKGRFELLREQLDQRANEIKKVVRKAIEDESAEHIKSAEKRSKKITANLHKVAKEAEALQADMRLKGVTSARSKYDNKINQDIQSFIGYHLAGWKPRNLDSRVDDSVSTIKSQHGIYNLNLRSNELSILEELSVDAIQGAQAKTFLDRIPEIDKLLPMPEEEARKALAAAK